MKNPLNALAGVLFVLSVCTAQFAIADNYSAFERRFFTIQSLQGSYAYINNSGGVASFGPMIFDGKGELTLKDKVNLPCASSDAGCPRSITDLTGEGAYTVNPDGTGVATITFTESNGTVRSPTDVFDFVISGAEKEGRDTPRDPYFCG